jgi:hypothetical protein
MPALRPVAEPVKATPPAVRPKLLPAVKLPVFEQPKLVMPKEVRREIQQPVEAPKIVVNNFAPPELKLVAGGARPQLVHTGDFGATGSSQTPTVNAAIEKVQTGGFGDPNGLTGTGKPNAKLYAAHAGSFDMPVGAGQGNGTGGAKGIKGTVASADFGNGVATGGKGDGRSNGKGVATGGFGSEQVVHQGTEGYSAGRRTGHDSSRNHLQTESDIHRGGAPPEARRRSAPRSKFFVQRDPACGPGGARVGTRLG